MLKAMFPEEYFDVRFSTKNGTYHHVYTKKPGKTVIEGVLTSIIQEVLLQRSLSVFESLSLWNETVFITCPKSALKSCQK